MKLSKLSLEDISDGYRTVLESIIGTVKQTQTVLPDNQRPHAANVPAIRQTIVCHSFFLSNRRQNPPI